MAVLAPLKWTARASAIHLALLRHAACDAERRELSVRAGLAEPGPSRIFDPHPPPPTALPPHRGDFESAPPAGRRPRRMLSPAADSKMCGRGCATRPRRAGRAAAGGRGRQAWLRATETGLAGPAPAARRAWLYRREVAAVDACACAVSAQRTLPFTVSGTRWPAGSPGCSGAAVQRRAPAGARRPHGGVIKHHGHTTAECGNCASARRLRALPCAKQCQGSGRAALAAIARGGRKVTGARCGRACGRPTADRRQATPEVQCEGATGCGPGGRAYPRLLSLSILTPCLTP